MSLLSSRNRVVAARYASSLPWSTSSYSYLCNKVLIHRSTVVLVHTWANVMQIRLIVIISDVVRRHPDVTDIILSYTVRS
jgi:hypothetical protein